MQILLVEGVHIVVPLVMDIAVMAIRTNGADFSIFHPSQTLTKWLRALIRRICIPSENIQFTTS